MTFERIKELSKYIPDNSIYYKDLSGNSDQIIEINKFIKAYSDLQFGYHFIKSIIDADMALPLIIDEEILMDAYYFLKFNKHKDYIIHAISLTHPMYKNMEDSLKALLITDDSFTKISSITGLPENVLRAYEQLFFNIRDRRQESLFIANIVYPNTKFIEMSDNYLKVEDPGKILLRSGYNNGSDDVIFFSGLKPKDFAEGSSSEMAAKLESEIMRNAYILARNSMLNTRSTGIGNAKGLLIAAKQGGQDSSKEDREGLGSLGDTAMSELLRIKSPEMEAKLDKYQALEEAKYLDTDKK